MGKVSLFPSFDDLPAEGQKLFDTAGEASFFDGTPWFRNLVKYGLDEGDRVRIYYAADEQATSPRAALATVARASNSGMFTPRRLCSLSSYYSSLFAPVQSSPQDTRESLRELARAIAADSPKWDEVELKPLDVNSPAFAGMVDGFEQAGFVVQTYFCFGNWYLEVRGRSFAEYVDSLPSALRNTLGRKKKKLEKSGRSTLRIISGGPDLDSAIEAYNKVYIASWKKPEPYPHFVPELIRTCARLGALRLGLVHVDGEPAAAQFWIVQNGMALIYKLAYDARFTSLSVGSVLTAAMMERAIDVDKVETVDYLTGDDAYKKDWMSDRRERWGILAMNPRTLRGACAIARHVCGRAIKRFGSSLLKQKPQGSTQAA